NVNVAIESIEFLSSSPGAAIAVSKMQSQFDWNVGAPLPAPQTVSIASATGSSLSWTASTNSTWLTVSPAAGTGGTSLTLSVNPSALALGASAHVVRFSCPGASTDPQTIPVTLSV